MHIKSIKGIGSVVRTCEMCGTFFRVKPSQVVRGGGITCSRQCNANRVGRIVSRPISERFWEKVSKTETCWPWTAAKSPAGYGLIGHNKRCQLAPRVSWELHFGPIPDGMVVCHHCDNPPCVRPDHLFLGTHTINHADMCAKGREAVPPPMLGADHPMAKLTDSQVIAIRKRFTSGDIRCIELSREYGVSNSTVDNILKRRTWKHID